MNDLYYTPELSELHFGYKLEYLSSNEFFLEEAADGWQRTDIGLSPPTRDMEVLQMALGKGWLRTPYLNREAIEAEGFNYGYQEGLLNIHEYTMPYGSFEETAIVLRHYVDLKCIRLSQENEQSFKGLCPSINELRRICKMVGIEKKETINA